MSESRKRLVQGYEICSFLDVTFDDLDKVSSLRPDVFKELAEAMSNEPDEGYVADGGRLADAMDAFFDVLAGVGGDAQ